MIRKTNKWVAVMTAGALILTSINMPFNKSQGNAATTYGIDNPRIEKDVVVSGEDVAKVEGKVRNPLVKADISTWDCIAFGNYWQKDTNGDGKVDQTDEKQPIKWRVLSVEGDDAFLMADEVLDSKQYNESSGDITWENCTLRKWLNEDFFNTAFSQEEQDAIVETKVINPDSPANKNSIEGGNDTLDKVYLLSRQEASDEALGFNSDFEYSISTNTRKTSAKWWLRSPASSSSSATIVGSDGSGDGGVLGFLRETATYTNGVRPVIHINLSKDCWKKANEVKEQDITTTWDCVYYGKYLQDANSMIRESIKWRVLAVDGEDVFLVADQGVDCQAYHESNQEVTWETSTLREWLNTDFVNEAFTDKEKTALINTKVVNQDDEYSGNDTTDKVYLLSKNEVTNLAYGFEAAFNSQDRTRRVTNTKYASLVQGALKADPQYGGDPWWLRTMSKENKKAVTVSWTFGTGNEQGEQVNKSYAVRPAVHMKLSSDMWEDAGTVSSSGEMTAPVFAKSTPKDYGIENPTLENSVSSWDCIYLGNYWQKDTNSDGIADKLDEKQPIKWRVLSVNGSEAFVLADKILDCHNYYNTTEPVDREWADSEIDNWLNNTFFKAAFSETEQLTINRTRIGSEITNVFLLSENEVNDGQYQLSSSWTSTEARKQAKRTQYAIACGAEAMESTTGENGNWMLRSMNLVKINNEWKYNKVKIVASQGYIGLNTIALDENCGIRPAMRINLDSAQWKYAGKVLQDGTVIKPEEIVKPSPTPSVTPLPAATPSLIPTVKPTQNPVPTSSSQPTQNSVPISSSQPTQNSVPTSSSQPTYSPSVSPSTEESETLVPPSITPTNLENQMTQTPELKRTDDVGKTSVIMLSKKSLSWKSVKNMKSGKVLVKWKKLDKATGYEVQYALNKSLKKAKKKRVKSTSITLKKLKKKKTYFIRVRAYENVNGKNVYGKWSSVKRVKIKK